MPATSPTIYLDVALPADTPAGTLMNQARLSDLPGDFGFEVLFRA